MLQKALVLGTMNCLRSYHTWYDLSARVVAHMGPSFWFDNFWGSSGSFKILVCCNDSILWTQLLWDSFADCHILVRLMANICNCHIINSFWSDHFYGSHGTLTLFGNIYLCRNGGNSSKPILQKFHRELSIILGRIFASMCHDHNIH